MTNLRRRRCRRSLGALELCVGLMSWQATICNGRSPTIGRPFLGGWRLSKKNSAEKLTYHDESRAFLGWRGGSDGYRGNDDRRYNSYQQQHPYQQQQQQQQQQRQQQYPPRQPRGRYNNNNQGGPPPELPPDLPDYGDSGDGSSSYSQPYPQQQQQQSNPQGYPGDPSLPDNYNNNNGYPADPSLPYDYGNANDDPMMMMMDEEPMPGGGNEPWIGDNGENDKEASNEPDLSRFDKEYIMKGLAKLYRKKILPLEKASGYAHFHSPPYSPADFDAPPAVLLLGPFSVGKTSFIKYLLGRDFPGIRVGPEPTTDRFTAVLLGGEDKIVPGAALCSQNYRPFTGLSPFGNNFLSRMEGVELDSAILRNVTLIDTPGILSGQKQRNRNYDYEAVMKWFAERADLIIIMFDAHKLDISDEMKQVMELMIPHLDKIRIVLNKADTISTQQLMRVYGALMWSLGKVMNTPEVCRVYMGSFWDKPLQHRDQEELLKKEEEDLLNDIMSLPQQAVMRRINELVKRSRSVKVHAYIIHYLRKQMPYNPWRKREKQRRLIDRLPAEFQACARRYGLPKGDFPPVEPMRRALLEIKDLTEYPKLDKNMVREMDKVVGKDIPELLRSADRGESYDGR